VIVPLSPTESSSLVNDEKYIGFRSGRYSAPRKGAGPQREERPSRELDRSARYYRSSGGGNKTAEASGGKVASGDSASLQLVTRANAEQASKLIMQELTQL
jgi:hypothetical protein